MSNAETIFKEAVRTLVKSGGKTTAPAIGVVLGRELTSLNGAQCRWKREALEEMGSYDVHPADQISEPQANGDAVECDPATTLSPLVTEVPAKRAKKAKAEKATPASKDPATSPTALARQMIARRANDETILAATKEKFGKDSKRPVLFTTADLKRLRARMK